MEHNGRTAGFSAIWDSASLRAVAYAALAGSALFFLHILAGERAEFNDFRYIWLAGHLWGQGVDPYTPLYIETSHHLLPRSTTNPWFYPFQWYGLSVPLGWMAPQPSMYVFMVLSVAASLGVGVLLYHVARRARIRIPRAVWILMLAYCLTSTIWDAVLRGRQPVIVAALGIPLLVVGLQRSSRPLMISGLVLLLAKPQMGIPFWVATAILEGGLIPACIAAVVTILLSIPALVIGGGLITISHLLQGMAAYQGNSYNQAMSMTGLPQLLYRLTGDNLPLAIASLMGIVAGCVCGAVLRWMRPTSTNELAVRFAFLLPVAIATFVSFHPYDLIILSFALPFLPMLPIRKLAPFAVGYFLLWRPENIVMLWDGGSEDAAAVATVGLAFLIIGTIAAWPVLRRWGDSAPMPYPIATS